MSWPMTVASREAAGWTSSVRGASLQLFQRLQAVSHQVINELLPGLGVVPDTGGLAGPGVVVVAAKVPADAGLQLGIADPSSPRMAARMSVTVSWVATAS